MAGCGMRRALRRADNMDAPLRFCYTSAMRTRWVAVTAIVTAGLAAMLVLHVVTLPDDGRYTVCQMRRLTGIPCPTCGMTRSLAMLAKGEWRRACQYHPLGPVVAAVIVGAWLHLIICGMRGRTPRMPGNTLTVAGIAVFLAASTTIWFVRFILPLLLHRHGAS